MCELIWCDSEAVDVRVDEAMDDGCWSVGICQSCADKLSVKDGDYMPDYLTAKRLLTTKPDKE